MRSPSAPDVFGVESRLEDVRTCGPESVVFVRGEDLSVDVSLLVVGSAGGLALERVERTAGSKTKVEDYIGIGRVCEEFGDERSDG